MNKSILDTIISDDNHEDVYKEIQSIKNCLVFVERELRFYGLKSSAHLIRASILCLEDEKEKGITQNI